MTRAERKAYAREIEQQKREEAERAEIQRKLDIIGIFRAFLIKSVAPDELRSALDDWTEQLCGWRDYFWSTHMNSPKKCILLPHERKKPE